MVTMVGTSLMLPGSVRRSSGPRAARPVPAQSYAWEKSGLDGHARLTFGSPIVASADVLNNIVVPLWMLSLGGDVRKVTEKGLAPSPL